MKLYEVDFNNLGVPNERATKAILEILYSLENYDTAKDIVKILDRETLEIYAIQATKMVVNAFFLTHPVDN